MPPLVALWRTRGHERRPASATDTPLASNASPLRRKIHPDLDALAAQFDSSHPDNSSPKVDLPSIVSSEPNFFPLMPRTRERPYSGPPQSTVESPDKNAHITTGDAWSTFGRGRKIPVENVTSTPGAPGSPELFRNAQFRTPTSASQSTEGSSSVSRSTQTRNRSSPSSHNEIVSTPQRPGRRSSPSSYHTFGRQTSSSHMPIERHPPLPPLAHPAFQSLTSGTHTLRSAVSNVSYAGVPEKYPRHYASLPSMSTARLRTVSAYCETSSSHHIDEPSGSEIRVPRQADRRSRRNGNRRSGAEYSSRQTTNAQADEAQVSAVRDALNRNEDDIPILGNACGNNVSCRQFLRLGNPFLLQDTNCHIVPWHGDNNDFPFTYDITISEKGTAKPNEMTKSDSPAHHKRNRSKDKGASLPSNRRQAIPPNRTHHAAPRKSISQSASGSLLVPPTLSLTTPTPEISPVLLFSPSQSSGSFPGANLTMPPALKSSITRTSGKRKADEADVEATPSKKATFAPDQRPHRVSENSGSSYAPSSYRHKRVRLSTSSDSRNVSRSPTVASLRENLNAGNTGSLSSRASTRGQSHTTPFHHSSQSQRLSNHSQSRRHLHESSRRQSLSGASIPISALVSPHAPSLVRRKTFHMHDPRKPGPAQRTSWMLSLPSSGGGVGSRWALNSWAERGGSPLHAWLFFLGFLFFPIWWLASFIRTPKTRRIGGGETEKGVVLDDPQVEHDSKSWRTRCRAIISISGVTRHYLTLPNLLQNWTTF
ncbi:hypothetical protein APHAL10511_002639 [Amanita phalloides]|nr:hypothetical protein APHAL10511_002639 [Amanita phalloides]